MSKVESALRSSIDFIEAFNRHDIPAISKLICEDCAIETSGPEPGGKIYEGTKQLEKYYTDLFRNSPDLKLEPEEITGLGIRCIIRWNCKTKKRNLRGIFIIQLKENKIWKIFEYQKVQ